MPRCRTFARQRSRSDLKTLAPVTHAPVVKGKNLKATTHGHPEQGTPKETSAASTETQWTRRQRSAATSLLGSITSLAVPSRPTCSGGSRRRSCIQACSVNGYKRSGPRVSLTIPWSLRAYVRNLFLLVLSHLHLRRCLHRQEQGLLLHRPRCLHHHEIHHVHGSHPRWDGSHRHRRRQTSRRP